MITRVLMATISQRSFDEAVHAWTGELELELDAQGAVSPELAGVWSVDPSKHARYAIIAGDAGDGCNRGMVRLVEGPEDDVWESFRLPGFFNVEMLCGDVDGLYDSLSRASSSFTPVASPETYDMSDTGAAVSRSFATRGPGGAGVFFTQYVSVPPPRVMPICPHTVCEVFNTAVAAEDVGSVESFYEGVLGMNVRFRGRMVQPSINRILGLPESWAFEMIVYKGEGDGLIEVDVHEEPLDSRSNLAPDRLKPGNSLVTLETNDLDSIVAGAAEAGALVSEARAVVDIPYSGRRVAALRGPNGETYEVVGA